MKKRKSLITVGIVEDLIDSLKTVQCFVCISIVDMIVHFLVCYNVSLGRVSTKAFLAS